MQNQINLAEVIVGGDLNDAFLAKDKLLQLSKKLEVACLDEEKEQLIYLIDKLSSLLCQIQRQTW